MLKGSMNIHLKQHIRREPGKRNANRVGIEDKIGLLQV
jgi:hypothetical protein